MLFLFFHPIGSIFSFETTLIVSSSKFKEEIIMRLFIVSLLFVFSLVGCTNNENAIPQNFNFRLQYGTYGKQKIDTFEGTVVKDLVIDGTVAADIAFTEAEMEEIYKKMIEINIMGELDYPKKRDCSREPESITTWEIKIADKTQLIHYKSFCEYSDDALNLIKLEDYIHELMASKEEYKLLPESNGHYE